MFWNANNTFGFDRIDWKRLSFTTTITTVSRYMKHYMWKLGVNPLVIPNGIPESSLDDVDTKASSRLVKSLDADLILAKIARWDPDKRWNAAFEAAARLKARGLRTVLLARGGIEHHGEEVLAQCPLSGSEGERHREQHRQPEGPARCHRRPGWSRRPEHQVQLLTGASPHNLPRFRCCPGQQRP